MWYTLLCYKRKKFTNYIKIPVTINFHLDQAKYNDLADRCDFRINQTKRAVN